MQVHTPSAELVLHKMKLPSECSIQFPASAVVISFSFVHKSLSGFCATAKT